MKPKKQQAMAPYAEDLAALDRDGFVALQGVIDARSLAQMRAKLDELLAVTHQEHAGTLIVTGLLEHPVFDAAWNHPRTLAAIESVLGPDFWLGGVASRGLRAGHGLQALHTDWGGQGTPGVWYVCQAIVALVDFTADNGATRVVPTSHKNPWMMKSMRDPRGRHPAEVRLLGKAGTVFILNSHCWHGAMQNMSRESRLAIFSSFSRRDSPGLQMMAPHANPSPEVLRRFGAKERRMVTADAPPGAV